jgi:hypothetical protein
MNIELTLNEQETTVLLNLIDLAVKAVGLQGAEAGLHFQKMIKAAQDAAASAVAVPLPAAETA